MSTKKGQPRYSFVVLEHWFYCGGDLAAALKAAAAYAETVQDPASVVSIRSEESDTEGYEVVVSVSFGTAAELVLRNGETLWSPWSDRQ